MQRRGSILITLAVAAMLLAGCAPKSKQFKLEKPTKAKQFLVTSVHVKPDGVCAEHADPAFYATAEFVARGVAAELEAKYGEAGISATYRETPEGLPFLYQRRIFTSDESDMWTTFFPSGECIGNLSADPKVPAPAAPFPTVELPDEWKLDAEAVLFLFVHNATLAGPPPTDLIEDVVEDYSYITIVGYTLIDVVDGSLLGSGHHVDTSVENMILEDAEMPAGDLAPGPGMLIEGEKIMNQVIVQTLGVQIRAIAEDLGEQLTAEE
jgi:hypothetical protein